MKLPKFSTVCNRCDEIIKINKSVTVIETLAIAAHHGYWIIQDYTVAQWCGACHMSGEDLPSFIKAMPIDFSMSRYGSGFIVRVGPDIEILKKEYVQHLQVWVQNNHGQPQF